MAYTTQQLEALEAAISQGVMSVEYGGKKVTFRTLSEMQQLRRTMRIDLGLLKPRTHFNPSISKGLNRRR